MHGVSALKGRRDGRERERVILCSPRIILAWVWKGPRAFSKESINFPSFCRLLTGFHFLC